MDDIVDWIPQLAANGGSFATRLADAIAADVAAGRLATGDRLPTQRELASRLGVTTGTINRAFALAARRGLLSAEVGRGSFVTGTGGLGIHDASLARGGAGSIEMGLNYPAGVEAEAVLPEAVSRLLRRSAGSELLALSPYAGRLAHRAAGARLLAQFGVSRTAEDVLVCTSVQHGIAATLAAVTAPGDVVLTEDLTSPGIKALAATHHLRLIGVESDADGLTPDALISACRSSSARVVYTMPTLHTPTTRTMPDDRRRAIAAVAEAEKLIVIEDDAWGFLAAGAVTPLVALVPERVVYLTSVSKSLAPGLRVGYVVAPASLRRAITSCIGATTWVAPLLAELVSQWIDDGTAASIMSRRVHAAASRSQLAQQILGPAAGSSPTPAFHLWITLPNPWRADEFVTHAGVLGVSLAKTDTFVPGRAPTPYAIRLCIGTERDVTRVEAGLRIIAGMLSSGPTGYSMSGP